MFSNVLLIQSDKVRGEIMAVTKKKIYFSPPTYKEINSILSKGWKLVSFNSTPCVKGDIISKQQTENTNYVFRFEKCDSDEQYYCLQCFVGYSMWSENQYQEIMGKIEQYRYNGAYIISVCHAAIDDSTSDVPVPAFSSHKKGEDVLYYIIVPKRSVDERDEESSYDAMLKFLGFSRYSNALHGMILFVLFALYILLISLFGFSSLGILNVLSIICIILTLCFYVKDCYYFFRYQMYKKKEYSLKYFMKTYKG